MKKIYAIFLSCFILFSCSKESLLENNSESLVLEKLTKKEKTIMNEFSKNSSLLYDKIGWEYFQEEGNVKSLPIINNGIVTHRVLINKYNSFLIDYSDWKNEITLKNLSDNRIISTTKMKFNLKTNLYEPLNSVNYQAKNREACIAACALSAFYMGLSDGPLPYADVAALIYLGLCIGECHENYAENS